MHPLHPPPPSSLLPPSPPSLPLLQVGVSVHKLSGHHPAGLTCQELAHSVHARRPYFGSLQALATGAPGSVRAQHPHGVLASTEVQVRGSAAFRWRFWKMQTYAGASWVLQKITENSGMSA